MRNNNVLKRIICFALFAVVVTTGTLPAGVKAAGDGPSYSTKKVIEWKRVYRYDDLPADTNMNYYMFLAWTSNNKDPNDYGPNDLSWHCITNNTGTYSKGTDALVGAQLATTFYGNIFPVDMDEFVTSSAYGMPKIEYAGEDGDNDDCPMYKITLNEGKGNRVLEDGSSNFKFNNKDTTKWGIMVREPGNNDPYKYEKSAKYDGTVCFFYNRSLAADSGFVFHTEKIACPKSTDYDKFDPFVMWVGREKEYSCINSDYAIMPGEVLDIKNDGIIIENGVKLTVYPGGTLSVSGLCINNGEIENYGTLIVQEGGSLFPMTRASSSVDTSIFDTVSNEIKCVGGSASVSIPGYKKKVACEGSFINFGSVGFSTRMGTLSLYSGSVMENYGFMVTGENLYVSDSALKNYGVAQIGYDMKNLASIRKLNADSDIPDMTPVDIQSFNFSLLGKSVAKTYANARTNVCGKSSLRDMFFSKG